MSAPLDENDCQPDEREIRFLSDQSGVEPAEVRTLFRYELARLGMGAKVHSYLAVLTASNVRGMLRRTARRSEAAQLAQECIGKRAPRAPTNDVGAAEGIAKNRSRRRALRGRLSDTPDVQSWEDDGGRMRDVP